MVGIWFAFKLQSVQQYAAKKATVFLAEKLKTKVTIGSFTTDWQNSVVLRDFYLQDQKQDTLIYAEKLGVDLNLKALLERKIRVNSIEIKNGTVNFYTIAPDSAYNYEFIKSAFGGKKTSTDTANTFSFKLKRIDLKAIRLRLHDPVRGKFISGKIGKLEIDMQEFDPENSIFRFKKVVLENCSGSYLQTKLLQASPSKNTLNLGFEKISLKKVKFDFENKVALQRIEANINTSEIKANEIDLRTGRVDLDKIELKDSGFKYFHDKKVSSDSLALNPVRTAEKLDSLVQKVHGTPVNWIISLAKLKLDRIAVSLYNYNMPVKPKGFDFNHMQFSDINLKVEQLYYGQKSLSASLQQLQLREKSGFKVISCTSEIKSYTSQIFFKNLDLKTGYSRFRPTITMKFLPVVVRKKKETKLYLDARLQNSQISAKDLLYFAPALAKLASFDAFTHRPFYLNGHIEGNADNLKFSQFHLKGLTGTDAILNGKISNIITAEKRNIDLRIQKFQTNAPDLEALLPARTIPPNFKLPPRISVSGIVRSQSGRTALQDFRFNANGTVLHLTGSVQGANNQPKYLNLNIKNLTTTRTAMLSMLPPGTISPEINVPENIHIAGTFKGSSIHDFATNHTLRTSFGNAQTNLKMLPGQHFKGTISMEKFDLGRVIKQEKMIGEITGKADFEGTGFKLKTMNLKFDTDVQEIRYKKITYTNVKIQGTLNQEDYKVHGNLGNIVAQNLNHKLSKIDPTRLVKKIFGRKKKKNK
jgi:translocation and assembly module TamB